MRMPDERVMIQHDRFLPERMAVTEASSGHRKFGGACHYHESLDADYLASRLRRCGDRATGRGVRRVAVETNIRNWSGDPNLEQFDDEVAWDLILRER